MTTNTPRADVDCGNGYRSMFELARTLESEAAQSLEATRLLTQQVTEQAATIATLRAALANVISDGDGLFPRSIKDGRRFRFELARAALAK